jgi:hypothetical protein
VSVDDSSAKACSPGAGGVIAGIYIYILELHGRYAPLSFVGSIGPSAQSQCVFVPIGVSVQRARVSRHNSLTVTSRHTWIYTSVVMIALQYLY